MGDVAGAEFKFETKTVNLATSGGNRDVTFRIPVPAVKATPQPDSRLDSPSSDPPFALNTENQHSVNVRAPFRTLIERNIEATEKLFGVRLTLQDVEGDLKLIASGDKAEAAVTEILNICRKSTVYNFYLCFPVRGEQFHKTLAEFQDSVRTKLGSNAPLERRPHITLALANLVTDADIDLVTRALQVTALTIKSVPKPAQAGFEPYAIDMEGLDVVKYRGKLAKRSVLMTNVALSDTLNDIAAEFQNSLNKTVNAMLSNQAKRKKLSRADRISNLTASQLAPKGINLTRGGNIEITFTDVPLVDPKGIQRPDDVAELKKLEEAAVVEPAQSETRVEEAAGGQEEDGDTEAEYEYDTSVKNKFHVTLLRHQHVSTLTSLKFKARGHAVCVELRARNGETCSFVSQRGELVAYAANRHDGEEEDLTPAQIGGPQPANVPNDMVVDLGAGEEGQNDEKFVFWI